MSVPKSPGRVIDPFEEGRWTVDNSRLVARSPARSILKNGSKTPDPYNSPNPSRSEPRQLRHARHVSFSPFDRVRLFGEHEATSESGRDRFRSVDHRPDSAVFDADPVASPQISDHPFLSRLAGSPSDQRKRRPDLFGSPPVHDANSPKRRFTERMQIAELQVFGDDDEDDDDDDEGEPTSFNEYMAGRKPPTAAELFDGVDDNDEAVSNKELSTSGQLSRSQTSRSHNSRILLERNPITLIAQDENAVPAQQQQHRQPNVSSLALSLKSPVVSQYSLHTQDSFEMDITQQSRNKSEKRNQNNDTLQSPFLNRNRIRYDAASEAGSDMEMTQERMRDVNVLSERTPTQRRQPQENRHLPNPRTSIAISEATSGMNVTYESNVRTEMLRRFRTNTAHNSYSPLNRNRTSAMITEADLNMEMTQELNRDNSTLQARSIHNTSQTSTPVRTSVFTSGLLPEIFGKSPTSQRIRNIVDETPGDLRLYSTPTRSHAKSSLRRQSNNQSAAGSEFGSDYGDRLFSMHDDGAGNILDEELSQLYDSSNEYEIPSPKPAKIATSEFLAYAGISFATSLPVHERKRTSGFDAKEGPVKISEQAVAAAVTIPELEMCKTYCEELKEFIKADEDAIARIDKEVSTNNPLIFSEYLGGNLQTQKEIDAKLTSIKEYAGFKAQQTLLEWKQTKSDSLLHDFELYVQKINEEEQYYEALDQKIQTNMSTMLKRLDELKQKLADGRKILNERNQIEYADESKENEIKEQRVLLGKYREDVVTLTEKESVLKNTINALNKREEELKSEIAKLEKEQDKSVNPETIFQRVKDKFDMSQRYTGLRILQHSDDAINLVIMNDLSLKIIGPNRYPRNSNNVLVNIVDEHKEYYGNFAKLVHELRILVQDMQDTNKIVETVAIYWNQAYQIHREISKAAARFYTEINPLEGQDGVQCVLVPSNAVHRTKITIMLDLKLQDLIKFPVINLNTVTVNLHGAPDDVSQGDAARVVRELLRMNGFFNLRNTLQAILERIRSKPTFPITPLKHM